MNNNTTTYLVEVTGQEALELASIPENSTVTPRGNLMHMWIKAPISSADIWATSRNMQTYFRIGEAIYKVKDMLAWVFDTTYYTRACDELIALVGLED